MPVNAVKKVFLRIPATVLWSVLIFLSLLLAHNAMLYFTHGGDYGILPEKAEARKLWLWNACFYVHLPSGVICLLTPFASFARNLFKITRSIHAMAGKIYVWITILIVCPTGMYLAFYAKGGNITTAGFFLQGILLGWYTWQGYTAMKERDVDGHVQNMIRSYAIATVVLSFRVLHILFFFLGVPYADNYAISQWLGLTVNLLIAEVIISIRSAKNSSLNTSTI